MSSIVLHAGPLQMALSSEEGSIRYIYAGEHEILRGINAPVRDEAWASIVPEISDLKIAQTETSFEVTFNARCRASHVDFVWQGKITGSPDGTLVFDFNGEALIDFRRNRIGFCVLHGAGVSGQVCTIEHGDGSREHGTFPKRIHPGAPFSDIRAIHRHITRDLEAEVRFEGEVFEMEDQRNWTDASFKTYCTPLAQPRPVFVARGTRITQRVTLQLRGPTQKAPANFTPSWRAPIEVEVTIGSPLGWNLPALGTRWTDCSEPSRALIENLRQFSLAHLRVDVWFSGATCFRQLESAATAAAKIGAALELAVFVENNFAPQIALLLAKLATLTPAPRIVRWLVFHQDREATPAETVIAVRAALFHSPFIAPVGGGSADNFAELNRNPEVAAAGDFTVHACNPQVHAFDEASMIETIEQQGLTVTNARQLSAGRPVIISPVTLTRRWRLNEAGAPTGVPSGVMPLQNDSRQDSPFAAAWSLGSLSALARERVLSVTYYEAAGNNGLLKKEGTRRPIAEIFAGLAPFSSGSIIATETSDPLCVTVIALAHEGRRMLMAANFRNAPQRIKVTGTWGNHTVQLSPYGIARFRVHNPDSIMRFPSR
jgi:hypothetical protein